MYQYFMKALLIMVLFLAVPIAGQTGKITGKVLKISSPTSNEKEYGEQDKFWCMPLPEKKRYKRCVDFQNDVYVSDIELAIREGFRSIEHV